MQSTPAIISRISTFVAIGTTSIPHLPLKRSIAEIYCNGLLIFSTEVEMTRPSIIVRTSNPYVLSLSANRVSGRCHWLIVDSLYRLNSSSLAQSSFLYFVNPSSQCRIGAISLTWQKHSIFKPLVGIERTNSLKSNRICTAENLFAVAVGSIYRHRSSACNHL